MTPAANVPNEQHPRKEIHGPRPSPLKINKDSHFIHKSISSSRPPLMKHQQQRHPVIIYTHSPKIIHTQARDFMALVQKLTGLASDNGRHIAPEKPQEVVNKASSRDDTESSSVLTDEHGGAGGEAQVSSSSVSPMFNPPNPYLADIPLFTPNSTDFFCSPRALYRCPDPVFTSPNATNSVSPSVLDFMKGLPEY